MPHPGLLGGGVVEERFMAGEAVLEGVVDGMEVKMPV